jgi:RNA polymerase sigma-70 factor (ECF subfamily)
MISLPTLLTPNPSASDDHLVIQAQAEPAAFGELYQRHCERVYRYHLVHTGDVNDAQDLTTQTFMAALEGLSSYRGTGSFGAWLLGIARHKMALHFRRRRPELPLENAAALADPGPSPEASTGRRLQVAQVTKALHRLSPDRAEALLLCLFADLTAREAGQVMGKSEAAVKMLVLRGLRDLREKFALTLSEE